MSPKSNEPNLLSWAAAKAAAVVIAATFVLSGCGRSSLFGFDPGEGDGCFGAGCFADLKNADLTGTGGPDFAGRDLYGVDFAGLDFSHPGDGADAGVDASIPCGLRREICDNRTDDNCNGLVDCDDPECAGDKACVKPGQEICNNGIDDDKNGLTDCLDPACATFPGCKPHMCDPAHPDCADPACVNEPLCKNIVCTPSIDFGTLQLHDSKSEKMTSTVGTTDVVMTPCAPGGGGQVITEFTVATNQTLVRLDFTEGMNGDNVFALFRAGVGQKCNANSLGCYDPTPATTGNTKWLLDAGHYYLIITAFTKQHQSKVDVTLSTPPSGTPMEICNNGVDDDKNGLTDCQDPVCFKSPFCKASECNPNENVGTVVVGDPGKMTNFSTNPADKQYSINCGGMGGDYAVQFSLAETAGIGLDFQQQGDHLIGLFRKPPAGQNCDAQPLDCSDPGRMQAVSYAWGEYPPGDYIFIFKAHKPGNEGNIQITIYAYANRKVELCHNGIDDDGNGLVDCQDPACFADPGCGAPVCMPDQDLGILTPGSMASTRLDIRTGIPNLQLSCAKSGGKAKVVQVELAQPGGMIFNCNQPSGQAVLGLFGVAGPRDPCDKLELDCADPAILPFKCNYIIPNLQAGTYYVIAQAFQAGSEGLVNLTLGAETERALEICNNSIDDDMDGFTDCADRKCATSPYCTPKACKADTGIDPMPLNGMPVIVNVDTIGKQVTAQPPCETKPGGGDAVVFINLPASAILKADWSQAFSSHVFAIYPDLGQGLICEAGKVAACLPSNGANTGSLTFPRLNQGKYWLVVAADAPGNEGAVTLRLSATP